ncbi:MAG: hypothetical protein ACRDIY_02145 [Chloroflexota bacterium]
MRALSRVVLVALARLVTTGAQPDGPGPGHDALPALAPARRRDAVFFSKKQSEAGAPMRTKAIRLSEDEAAEFSTYASTTGEVEASVLNRAALRGLKELRLEQGILAYLDGQGSADAAAIAGLPRAEFLHLLTLKGVIVLGGPSSLATELDALARRLGNRRLSIAAARLSETAE